MSKVLVADSNPERSERLTGLLRDSDYTPTAVTDGPAALRAARADEYALAILDLELPLLSGLEVLRELRRESNRPVILFGPDLPDAKRAAVLLDVDRYLVRPDQEGRLLNAIRAILTPP